MQLMNQTLGCFKGSSLSAAWCITSTGALYCLQMSNSWRKMCLFHERNVMEKLYVREKTAYLVLGARILYPSSLWSLNKKSIERLYVTSFSSGFSSSSIWVNTNRKYFFFILFDEISWEIRHWLQCMARQRNTRNVVSGRSQDEGVNICVLVVRIFFDKTCSFDFFCRISAKTSFYHMVSWKNVKML